MIECIIDFFFHSKHKFKPNGRAGDPFLCFLLLHHLKDSLYGLKAFFEYYMICIELNNAMFQNQKRTPLKFSSDSLRVHHPPLPQLMRNCIIKVAVYCFFTLELQWTYSNPMLFWYPYKEFQTPAEKSSNTTFSIYEA